MKKQFQAWGDQELRQNPKQAAAVGAADSQCDKAALSDEELSHVSAGSDVTVPTMYPNVLLGRHDIPDDTEKNKP